MALRDVSITFDVHDADAGALYELWLKEGAGAWALHSSGAAEVILPTQSFFLAALQPATAYEVRLRMSIDGRYRDAYTPADPDSWPAESLLTFTTDP